MTKPKVHCFACASEQERNSWVQDISDAINISVLMDQVDVTGTQCRPVAAAHLSADPELGPNGAGVTAIRADPSTARGYQTLPRHLKPLGSPAGERRRFPTTNSVSPSERPSSPPSSLLTPSPLQSSPFTPLPPASSQIPSTMASSSPGASAAASNRLKFADSLTLRPHNKGTLQAEGLAGSLLPPKPLSSPQSPRASKRPSFLDFTNNTNSNSKPDTN